MIHMTSSRVGRRLSD